MIKGHAELLRYDHEAFKDFIEHMYAYSLKGLTSQEDRNIVIDFPDEMLIQPNETYINWENEYNFYDIAGYNNFLRTDRNFAIKIKKMHGILLICKKNKNYKRIKKAAGRLYHDIDKVCRTFNYTCNNEYEFHSGLYLASLVYKEALLKISYRLCSEIYDMIPNDLCIIKDGNRYAVKDFYRKLGHISGSTYYLDSNVRFSKKDLRNIQLEIYPYIVSHIIENRNLYF